MKRLVIAILAGVTAVAAWTLPAPDVATGVVDQLPEPASGARAGVWFCGGSAGQVDPVLVAAVTSPGLVGFTLPLDGEVLDSYETWVEAGVGEWDVGDGLPFHSGSAIVETSTVPSAAAVVYRGPEQVAGDECHVAAKEWYLNGAAIDPTSTLTLRLFNPLLEQGRVSLEVVSEFGFEPLLDFESVTIGPRTWEDISLSLLLGDREQVAVRVSVEEGVVIPSLHATGPDTLAVWPGESPSSSWEFPLAQVAGTAATISIWNPGTDPAEVNIELIGRQGPLGLFDLVVGPGREERFDVSEVTSAEAAAVVRSSVAVVAAARSQGSRGDAATVGTPRPAERWLVPSNDVVSGLASFVFVLNSGDEPVQLLAGAIGQATGPPVELDGHTLTRLDLSGPGAEISATGPITVAWLVAGSRDTGLGLGVPLAPPIS